MIKNGYTFKIIYIYKNKKNVFLYLHDGSMSKYHDNLVLDNKNNQKGLFRIVTIDSTNNNYFMKCQKKLFLKNELVNIIVKKQDTLIKDKEKLKIGNTYKLALQRYFWSDTLEIYNFSHDNDLKFYSTNDLINLNYLP
uniref:hypothetical protein n=1 Tax=Flavobacterium sp. TaxID=239 RepID=UPI0040493849